MQIQIQCMSLCNVVQWHALGLNSHAFKTQQQTWIKAQNTKLGEASGLACWRWLTVPGWSCVLLPRAFGAADVAAPEMPSVGIGRHASDTNTCFTFSCGGCSCTKSSTRCSPRQWSFFQIKSIYFWILWSYTYIFLIIKNSKSSGWPNRYFG